MNKNNNILDDNENLLKLYTLAEMAYQKHFSNLIENKEYLFPENWYEKTNYKQKIEIIAEAINNNVLIENTTKYQTQIEGIPKKLVKD